jgi:hypothetical protein
MHPTAVGQLLRRAGALVVALILGSPGWAECAGWQVTAEARMACCSHNGPCPMHRSTGHGSSAERSAERVVTQAQADSCCAASDPDDSTPPALAFFISLSAALVASPLPGIAPITAPPAPFDSWLAHVPLPGSHAPKHLLLSVFLI